ncbi:MAG TPA: hypothetical protein VGB37_14755 [Candidatus Lokiarchaeia archaeon]
MKTKEINEQDFIQIIEKVAKKQHKSVENHIEFLKKNNINLDRREEVIMKCMPLVFMKEVKKLLNDN